jgi:hypothetical protein
LTFHIAHATSSAPWSSTPSLQRSVNDVGKTLETLNTWPADVKRHNRYFPLDGQPALSPSADEFQQQFVAMLVPPGSEQQPQGGMPGYPQPMPMFAPSMGSPHHPHPMGWITYPPGIAPPPLSSPLWNGAGAVAVPMPLPPNGMPMPPLGSLQLHNGTGGECVMDHMPVPFPQPIFLQHQHTPPPSPGSGATREEGGGGGGRRGGGKSGGSSSSSPGNGSWWRAGGAIRERWRAQRQAEATKRTVYVSDICSTVRAPPPLTTRHQHHHNAVFSRSMFRVPFPRTRLFNLHGSRG